MLLTGIPVQFVQKQVEDLWVATPPNKRELMERFVDTHRAVCDRVGVKLAPKTDKEKAFSCETKGTVLGVAYDTLMRSWNLTCEKVKCILHILYDMLESVSVTNELAMKRSGVIIHYSPLFPGSKWWRRPLISLPDYKAGKRKTLFLSIWVRRVVRWWIMMFNRLRQGNLPIKEPLYLIPCYSVPVFTDTLELHMRNNSLHRGGGVYLPDDSLVRII